MPSALSLSGLIVVIGFEVSESFRVGVVEDFRRISLAVKFKQDILQYYNNRK